MDCNSSTGDLGTRAAAASRIASSLSMSACPARSTANSVIIDSMPMRTRFMSMSRERCSGGTRSAHTSKLESRESCHYTVCGHPTFQQSRLFEIDRYFGSGRCPSRIAYRVSLNAPRYWTAEVGERLVVETIARIRRELPGKGTPIRKLVRDLKVARNTIRKAVRSDEPPFSDDRTVQPRPG